MNVIKSQDSEMQETLHSKSQQTEIFSTHGGSNLAKRQDTGIGLWLGFTIGWDTVSAIKHVVRIASLMQYLLQDRRIMSVHFQKSIGGVYTTLLHSDESAYLYMSMGYVKKLVQKNWKHWKENIPLRSRWWEVVPGVVE
jgi:hypothetical protein